MTRTGYLGLGSNVGDRESHLRAAIDLLRERGLEVEAISSTYETEPVGEVLDQPDFLNAAIRIRTDLEPEALLDLCKEVETKRGRALDAPRHSPRPLDVDLLLLGDLELSTPRLTLPHPEVTSRRFVLAPLLELDPSLSLPDGTRLAEVLPSLGPGQRAERVGRPPGLSNMPATTDSRDGLEINGVAHVVFRVNRIEQCIAFYDQLMPFLGLQAVHPRSEDFVYYVGGRTALAIRRADPEHFAAAHAETAPGIDHLCFRARRREDVDALYSFLQDIGADIVRAPVEGPWAPGYYSLSFRDPEGIRLELNHVPGIGLLAEGAAFDPDPDYPLSGQPRSKD